MTKAEKKPVTAQDMIDYLSEVDPCTPLYFYHSEGGLEDDQRTPIRAYDIDTEIEGVVDINLPLVEEHCKIDYPNG